MNVKWYDNIYLDINGRSNPMGIDEKTPVFHYWVSSKAHGKKICAYQICVYDEENTTVWDSGKCKATDAPYITYAGEHLEAKHVYFVKIRLWDESDCESEYSEPVSFETGFFDDKWQAKWIEPQQEDAFKEKSLAFYEMFQPTPDFFNGEERLKCCKEVRRDFEVSKGIRKARIYATAHGIYNLYINGRKVSEHRLAPEVSSYENILYYQTYDITGYLTEGKNVLGMILADGWWIGRLGMSGESCNYGNRLGCLLQMELTYEDGFVDLIGSDKTFRCRDSYIQYSDLYIGEKWDLTRKQPSWMQVEEENSDWDFCTEIEAEQTQLLGQPIDSVCVIDHLLPQSIEQTGENQLLIDFGQVLAGVVSMQIRGRQGQCITFEHGEVLEADGTFKNNIQGRFKNQKDVLVCKEGNQKFEPQFTYHGFRYLRITGAKKEQISYVTANVIGTPLKQTGTFICSDPKLNQLQHNILWSAKGNMVSIPTDCPQREKLGWTGDIQVFAPTGCYNYDLRSFLRGWLMNVRADQYENGEVPVVVPNFPGQERMQIGMSGSNSSAAWSDAVVLVPYAMYQAYGDVKVLKENFEAMKAWLGFVKEVSARKPEGYEQFTPEQKERNPFLFTKCYHFGDWLIPSLRDLPDGVPRGTAETASVVGSCYYAITVEAFIQICNVLKEEQLAANYQELLVKIRQAVSDEYVSEDGIVNGSRLQGLYVMVLRAGAVCGEKKKAVLRRLVSLIKENDYCLDTGFASVGFLLDVLYDNGYPEVAYKLLYQTKAPSWLYMVENGATTMWENWKAIQEDRTRTDSSYNHYAFGCVGDWIYRHIGGICPLEPGYRKVLFKPDISCGLDSSKCTFCSVYGPIELEWKKQDGRYVVQGVVPVGVEALLCVGTVQQTLSSGAFRMEIE